MDRTQYVLSWLPEIPKHLPNSEEEQAKRREATERLARARELAHATIRKRAAAGDWPPVGNPRRRKEPAKEPAEAA